MATPAKSFRKRTEEKTEKRAKQTPGQVYGQEDSTKRLGRKARTGIEADVATKTAGLKFDVAGERAAREKELDRRAQEGRERMARTFGITSSGMQQGRAIRAFSGLEAERLKQQAALESEFSQRRGQEQRANIQSLSQVQESREAADLRAREATGQDVERQQRALETGEQLEFQKGVATGEIEGVETEAARATKKQEEIQATQQTEVERATKVRETQQGAVQAEVERATKKKEEQLGRKLTEEERAAEEREAYQRVVQEEVERAAVVRETQQGAVQAEVERATKKQEEQLGRRLTEEERAAEEREAYQRIVQEEVERATKKQEEQLGRKLTEEERAAEEREAYQRIVQEEVERAALKQEEQLGRKLTEEERSALVREHETMSGRVGQEQLQLRAQLDSEVSSALQRAVAQGRETGKFVDPETGVAQETLEAEMKRRQQTEVERSTLEAEEDRRATLTGIIPGDQNINDVAVKEMLGLDPAMTREQVADKAAEFGFVHDANTGLFTAPSLVTVEARMKSAQAYALRKGVDVQADAQSAEEANMKAKVGIDQAAISGKIALFDPEGDPLRDAKGEPITVNTLAADELVFREGVATGTVDDKETLENKKMQFQQEIERGQAFLREDLQAANIAFKESDITGTYSKMGAAEAGQFYRAFSASKGGEEFNPRYDLNKDGAVDAEDFAEFSRVANGEPVTTLRGKQLENDKAGRLHDEKLEEAQLTGMIDEGFTVQELSRQFEEERVITDMFGGKPPTTFTKMDMDPDRFPYDKKRTDPGFRSELDFNSDGVNNFDDYMIGKHQIDSAESAAADTERLEVLEAKPRLTAQEKAELGTINKRMGGNRTKLVTGTKGMYMFQPPGPQTLKAQELGVTEKKFTEGVRQWNKQFGQQIADYKSRFSGYMVDENGDPEKIWNEKEKKYIQATRSERELFDKQMDKMDTLMQEGGMEKFAESMGLEWDTTNKLNRQEQLAMVQSVMSLMFNPVNPTPMGGGKWWEKAMGAAATVGAGFAASDRNIKHDVQDISSKAVLDMAKSVPVSLWRYDEDPDTQHIGPMAQDFKDAFGVGSSDKVIHVVDMFGVALASIQALSKEVESLKSEVKRLSN